MASLDAVFGTCKYNLSTSKRNVPLSEATVRLGHSSVICCYCRNWQSLQYNYYNLSLGRYLIHNFLSQKTVTTENNNKQPPPPPPKSQQQVNETTPPPPSLTGTLLPIMGPELGLLGEVSVNCVNE